MTLEHKILWTTAASALFGTFAAAAAGGEWWIGLMILGATAAVALYSFLDELVG